MSHTKQIAAVQPVNTDDLCVKQRWSPAQCGLTCPETMLRCCRVAIPINKFNKAAEQDVEDWYELGKNDFAAEAGTVSTVQACINLRAMLGIAAFAPFCRRKKYLLLLPNLKAQMCYATYVMNTSLYML